MRECPLVAVLRLIPAPNSMQIDGRFRAQSRRWENQLIDFRCRPKGDRFQRVTAYQDFCTCRSSSRRRSSSCKSRRCSTSRNALSRSSMQRASSSFMYRRTACNCISLVCAASICMIAFALFTEVLRCSRMRSANCSTRFGSTVDPSSFLYSLMPRACAGTRPMIPTAP